ncbi:grpE protein homolog 1, mitochondrial-like [Corticium candelabrum]|uniref:grpE protein homolog 1, mitochondrial-like n=1 Tax=Corticium candelabrum TaxID=121492 RepID=UPI002E2705C4|nr:grpE protein homolog 1, mitochondrial-like [Corticium candelabrum]
MIVRNVCQRIKPSLNTKRFLNFLRFRAVSDINREPESTESSAAAEGKADATATAEETPRECEDEEKILKLEELVQQLDEKYKRCLAETENVRKMYRKQVEDAKLFGIQSFAKDLLDVADTLELATESMKTDPLVQGNESVKQLYDGVQMTTGLLLQVFARNGLVKTNPLGEKFDPNFHEAMLYQEAEDKMPGSISMVLKTGYLLHGRTVRAAQVGVVKDKS